MPMPLNIGTSRALLGTRRGPVLWLRRGADQFTDANATIPATTGDAVAAWKDGTIVFVQSTSALRPIRQAGGELLVDGAQTQRIAAFEPITLVSRSTFALAVWVRPTVDGFIYDKNSAGTITTRDYWIATASGAFTFGVATNNGGTIVNATATSGVFASAWRLVVGTIGGSVIRLFVDGTEHGSAALTFPLNSPTSGGITIGARSNNTLPLSGSIGDIRVWHRALDAAEIAALWTAERGSYGV